MVQGLIKEHYYYASKLEGYARNVFENSVNGFTTNKMLCVLEDKLSSIETDLERSFSQPILCATLDLIAEKGIDNSQKVKALSLALTDERVMQKLISIIEKGLENE